MARIKCRKVERTAEKPRPQDRSAASSPWPRRAVVPAPGALWSPGRGRLCRGGSSGRPRAPPPPRGLRSAWLPLAKPSPQAEPVSGPHERRRARFPWARGSRDGVRLGAQGPFPKEAPFRNHLGPESASRPHPHPRTLWSGRPSCLRHGGDAEPELGLCLQAGRPAHTPGRRLWATDWSPGARSEAGATRARPWPRVLGQPGPRRCTAPPPPHPQFSAQRTQGGGVRAGEPQEAAPPKGHAVPAPVASPAWCPGGLPLRPGPCSPAAPSPPPPRLLQ